MGCFIRRATAERHNIKRSRHEIPETRLKFIEQGIVYDDLSDSDKQAYEDTFGDENGVLPERKCSGGVSSIWESPDDHTSV